jgi:hypothetical protein
MSTLDYEVPLTEFPSAKTAGADPGAHARTSLPPAAERFDRARLGLARAGLSIRLIPLCEAATPGRDCAAAFFARLSYPVFSEGFIRAIWMGVPESHDSPPCVETMQGDDAVSMMSLT